MDTSVDIQVTGSIPTEAVLGNFAALYTDPWFLNAIILTFLFGRGAQILLREFYNHLRDAPKLMIVCVVQAVIGYLLALLLVDHPEVHKFGLITGANSILLFYALLFIALRFKYPRLATWLMLKNAHLEDGHVILTDTIQMFRDKGK